MMTLQINSGSGNAYLLYVLTVSGVAYLLSLRSPFSYISGSSFPQREYVEFNVAPPTQITAMTAAAGCLVTGRQDGVVSCFQLGILDPSSPGSVQIFVVYPIVVHTLISFAKLLALFVLACLLLLVRL